MRSFAAIATVVALASAQSTTTSSVPTGPPMGVYRTDAAVPAITATTVVPVSSATPLAKRDATICLAQPTGIAHTTIPDTAAAFLADVYYSSAALAAGVPSGYTSVFTNTTASPNADQYMGFTFLTSYDVQSCASQCSAISGCNSFNVYFERDPSVDPNDASCLDPSSVTQIKCIWWGSFISPAVNVNNGQWRGNFQVVIAGSNGYTRNTLSSSSSSSSSIASPFILSSSVALSSSTSSSIPVTTSSSTTTKAVTSSTSLTTLATSIKTTSASSTKTSTSSTTSAAATSTVFNIQLNWSGTDADTKYLSVSQNGIITFGSSLKSAAKFTIDSNSDLVNVGTGLALGSTSTNGAWQRPYFTSLTQKSGNFADCAINSPYVSCSLNDAFQYAGVCSGGQYAYQYLYFGVPSKMPSNCQWIGLFPVTASS